VQVRPDPVPDPVQHPRPPGNRQATAPLRCIVGGAAQAAPSATAALLQQFRWMISNEGIGNCKKNNPNLP